MRRCPHPWCWTLRFSTTKQVDSDAPHPIPSHQTFNSALNVNHRSTSGLHSCFHICTRIGHTCDKEHRAAHSSSVPYTPPCPVHWSLSVPFQPPALILHPPSTCSYQLYIYCILSASTLQTHSLIPAFHMQATGRDNRDFQEWKQQKMFSLSQINKFPPSPTST